MIMTIYVSICMRVLMCYFIYYLYNTVINNNKYMYVIHTMYILVFIREYILFKYIYIYMHITIFYFIN